MGDEQEQPDGDGAATGYVSDEIAAVVDDMVERKIERVTHHRADLKGLQNLLNDRDETIRGLKDQVTAWKIEARTRAETVAAYEMEIANAVHEMVAAIAGADRLREATENLAAQNVTLRAELRNTVDLYETRIAKLNEQIGDNAALRTENRDLRAHLAQQAGHGRAS